LKVSDPTYMDKTGRNGIRVGDIELEDFKESRAHWQAWGNDFIYDVNIQYNLDELEKEFFESKN
jgi:adenylosuccinate synthase